jgi:hypothetical protein
VSGGIQFSIGQVIDNRQYSVPQPGMQSALSSVVGQCVGVFKQNIQEEHTLL